MSDAGDIRGFLDWFSKNGGWFHPGVDVIHDAEHGVYVRTRDNLDPTDGDVAICKCLPGLTMSSLNVRGFAKELGDGAAGPSVQAGPLTQALSGYVDSAVISHFMLMEERSLGETSHWYSYIQLLPKSADMMTPLYFDSDDLAWLSGTNIHVATGNSAVEERYAARKQEWEAIVKVLSGYQLDSMYFTFEWYIWAATIFTSRSFTSQAAFGPSDDAFPILYPGVDLLNHSPKAKVVWDFDHGTFTLSTTQRVDAGAEVFNNYAPKGNEELLMGYGFAIEDNPTDTVRVVLPCPPAPVQENLRKALPEHFKSTAWDVKEASFDLRGRSHYSGSYDHGITCLRGVPYAMFRMMAELVYFMSTQEMDGAADALEEADFFAFVVEQFLNPLRNKRSAIPNIKSEPINQKQRYAKIYRDGQIRILDEVIMDLETFLASNGDASED